MSDLGRLTAKPIAHRGLHDSATGGSLVENTIEAAEAAAAAGYGIECDVQLTGDGEVVVFHDDALDRLTAGKGALRELSLAALRNIAFKNCASHIPTLQEFLARVAGRVPVLVELKSSWDGSTELVEKSARIVAEYTGPTAIMSFDPQLVHALRLIAPHLTRGIVAERYYDNPDWTALSPRQKFSLGNLMHIPQTRPDFIAYWVRDLPAFAPLFARNVLGMPLLTWTVRTEKDRACARRWADQMIFEGFRP
ncbi:MAG TPA: glycerophosphodiester phosphodiesterase family protein [Xanthobacteraceae bacterium]|nr:glycerophosphodiester phosphodiesterase family protein [Xanthobacteraceae bacterium]